MSSCKETPRRHLQLSCCLAAWEARVPWLLQLDLPKFNVQTKQVQHLPPEALSSSRSVRGVSPTSPGEPAWRDHPLTGVRTPACRASHHLLPMNPLGISK